MNVFAGDSVAAWALAWREIVRFFRQRNRIVGSIGTPLVFWLLFGAGLSARFGSVRAASRNRFLTYFFPGSLLLDGAVHGDFLVDFDH